MGAAEKIQQAKAARIERAKRKNRVTLLILIFALCAILAGLYFGYTMLKEYMDEESAHNEIASIRDLVADTDARREVDERSTIMLPTNAESLVYSTLGANNKFQVLSDGTYTKKPVSSDEKPIVVEDEEPIVIDDDYMDKLMRAVDFKALKNINSDCLCWLWIPDTNIDYYVMQEQEDEKFEYIWKDIYHKKSGVGSLLVAYVPGEQTDAHLLIFGHHMKRRDVMFSNLLDWRDKSFAELHPYIFVYYPDHAECWKVWTCANAQADSIIYDTPFILGSDGYQEMLDETLSLGFYELAERPDKNTRTLYLSTCDKLTDNKDRRLVLVGVPDIFYYYDENLLTRGPKKEEVWE